MSEVLKPFVCRALSLLWNMLPVNRLCCCINEAYSSPAFVCLDFKLTAAQQQPFKVNNSLVYGDTHTPPHTHTHTLKMQVFACYDCRVSHSQNYSLFICHYQSWFDLASEHNCDLLFYWRSLRCCLV